MVSFSRQGKTIIANIETGVASDAGGSWGIETKFECSGELEARLILEAIKNNESSQVNSALKAMYEVGFKDAKHHKTKKAWFPSKLTFRF